MVYFEFPDYCQECKEIEPRVEYQNADGPGEYSAIIYCKYRSRCAKIIAQYVRSLPVREK